MDTVSLSRIYVESADMGNGDHLVGALYKYAKPSAGRSLCNPIGYVARFHQERQWRADHVCVDWHTVNAPSEAAAIRRMIELFDEAAQMSIASLTAVE